MNATASTVLCRFVKAACPQQKFDEYTPDAWHELLADLDFADCRTAVVTLGKRQPFISPSEIRAEVQRVRGARIERAWLDVPAADADPDDVNLWLDAVRAENRRIGDGGDPRPPTPQPKRDVAALIAGTVEKMPHVTGSTEVRSLFEEALKAKRQQGNASVNGDAS
jgi:hypothetical protein